MIKFYEISIGIEGSTIYSVLSGCEKMKLCPNLKDRHKKVVLNLKDIFLVL